MDHTSFSKEEFAALRAGVSGEASGTSFDGSQP